MNITKENIIKKFSSFEAKVSRAEIPEWDSLPDIELYMDQVIVLLNQYLKGTVGTQITQSMINNYVKQKAVPAPVKKRYSKIHLCYLIVFCTLKQSLSIATIQKIMPVDLKAEEVKAIYSSFLENRQKSVEYTLNQVKKLSETLEKINDANYCTDIIMQFSAVTGTFKALTENILSDDDENKDENK